MAQAPTAATVEEQRNRLRFKAVVGEVEIGFDIALFL
jgi:hypothetical protein